MKQKIVVLVLCVCCQTVLAQNQWLPNIPEPLNNPHLAKAFEGVKPVDKPILDKDLFVNGDEMLVAAFAYLHPQSPYKSQPEVLNRLIALLNWGIGNWSKGIKLGDMSYNFHANAAYFLLKTYSPAAIPDSQKVVWEAALRSNMRQILQNTNLYQKQIVGAVWLNGDIRIALGGYFGALALHDSVNQKIFANTIENCMTQTLLPDGGTHYVGYQNESPTYHGGATIRYLLWYYLLTQSAKVKQMVMRTKNYIPMMWVTLGKGFHEWTTSPAWKPYYNTSNCNAEALAKAYLTGDSYNYTIGKGSQELYLAFLYKSGLQETVLPNNFMLFDKNTLGPRGRYGMWGLQGTARNVSQPQPELNEPTFLNMDGINTYAGAYVLDAHAAPNQYPLNAAFQGTAPQVKIKKGKDTDFQRGNVWAFLTGKKCLTAVSKSVSLYGLSAEHAIAGIRFRETDWQSVQQWLFLPERLIGLVEMHNATATTAYGLAHRLALSSGRLKVSGNKKTLLNNGNGQWEYGDLLIKVHQQNYLGSVETFEYGTMNHPDDTYSTMIVLHDSANTVVDQPKMYPSGTSKWALIEVIPKKWQRLYTNAQVLTLPNGLKGFGFADDKQQAYIIHNTTDTAIEYQALLPALFSHSRILYSNNTNQYQTLPVHKGSTKLVATILPHAHIVVVNSSATTHMEQGFHTYNTIFPDAGVAEYVPPVTCKASRLSVQSVQLTWPLVTAGTRGYEVLRSTDGKTFTVIATVLSQANAEQRYQDSLAPKGKLYYKLLQLDEIGQSHCVAMVTVPPAK